MNELRIYVILAKTVQVPGPADHPFRRSIEQPAGRQAAQIGHVVSKIRWDEALNPFGKGPLPSPSIPVWYPITTIILQARDSAELQHIQTLLLKKKLKAVPFFDTNHKAYGTHESVMTTVAVLATEKQVENITDYLPAWGRDYDKPPRIV